MDRVVYYRDEKNDDFSPTHQRIATRAVPADYPYRRGPLFRLASAALYRLVAVPLVWVYCKLAFGLRVKNKKALRRLGGACYLYANHTSMTLDAFLPALLSFPRRGEVLVGPDAVSLPVVRTLVALLGGLPLPGCAHGMAALWERLAFAAQKGRNVLIFPEAHIWPFYNGVRPFADTAFAYPVRLGLPVVAAAVVWKQRRFFKKLPPRAEVHLSDPFYADAALSPRAARRALRDDVHDFLCRTVAKEKSFAYIQYIKEDVSA